MGIFVSLHGKGVYLRVLLHTPQLFAIEILSDTLNADVAVARLVLVAEVFLNERRHLRTRRHSNGVLDHAERDGVQRESTEYYPFKQSSSAICVRASGYIGNKYKRAQNESKTVFHCIHA